MLNWKVSGPGGIRTHDLRVKSLQSRKSGCGSRKWASRSCHPTARVRL